MPSSISLRRRTHIIQIALGGFAGCLIGNAQAVADELYNNGQTSLRWDNTFLYSAGVRLNGASPQLLADPNGDDGDRAFRPGLISNRLDIISQLGFEHGSFGGEISGHAWYDTVYNGHDGNTSPATFNPASVPNTSFTSAVRALEGRDAELLNGYLYDNFDVGGMPVSVRVGRQALIWGESLYFAGNGIAAGQAPIDATQESTTPYAEASQVYLPVAQLSASIQPSANVSIGFYYQFEWRRDRLPGVGSYFSAADFADVGGERIIAGPDQYLLRGKDITPSHGQFGVDLHLAVRDTDFGFYALRFDAKDPQVYVHPYAYAIAPVPEAQSVELPASYGVPSGTGDGGAFKYVLPPGEAYIGTGTVGYYNLVFPQDIQLFGASVSTYLGSSTIAAEISGRRNMPLVSTPQLVQPGAIADSGAHPLYAVGDTLHAQVSSTENLAPTRYWDGVNLSMELAANRLLDVTKNPGALDPTRDKFALAGRGTVEVQYFKVLPSLDVSVPVSLGYGLVGNSSVDGSQNEKAGDFEAGLRFLYRAVWAASITYTHYIGAPARQPFADRDYIALTVRRTF